MADYADREHEEVYCANVENCVVGHALMISILKDGRGLFEINPKPINDVTDSPALREFMKETIMSWLDQLDEVDSPNEASSENDDLGNVIYLKTV